MFLRIGTIALNTYREAVRARILHGLFGLALATGAYSLVVAAFTLNNGMRVVSDLGAASISIYGIVVAVVLMATSLYRELELKTIFPILARPLRRHEYLVGKYIGTVLTLGAFVAANTGALLLAVAHLGGRPVWQPATFGAASTVLAAVLAWRVRRWRTWLPLPWAMSLLLGGYWMASSAFDERAVLLGSAVLTMSEVSIVTGIALVFASFSSPFLTAVFTLSVFIVGRSADTLARLPERVFGSVIHGFGAMLARITPNLMVYVPPRPLLTGEQPDVEVSHYLLMAMLQALLWSGGLLIVASIVFRRRDFQ